MRKAETTGFGRGGIGGAADATFAAFALVLGVPLALMLIGGAVYVVARELEAVSPTALDCARRGMVPGCTWHDAHWRDAHPGCGVWMQPGDCTK